MSPFDEQALETRTVDPPPAPAPGERSAKPPTEAAGNPATGERPIPGDAQARDAHPEILVTPSEVIQLVTGARRPLGATGFVPRKTAVDARGECPGWRRFLARITARDGELEAHLQRMAGYFLTGSTAENMLFFLHGPGANGKTVFTNTLANIMGRYAGTLPTATLLAGGHGWRPSDLGRLARARLLTARETEEGERWAEARIKAWTGGDPLAAKRGPEVFEFTPAFKLLVVGNYKPAIKNIDLAIRRRIQLIPFRQVIPPAERDIDLADRLWGEAPGILQWMVEGAQAWFRDGLALPAAVREATADYLDGEDLVGQWIAQCCAIGNNAAATTAELFQSWRRWAEGSGHPAGTQRRLSEALEARGLQRARLGKDSNRGFLGIVVDSHG